MTRSSLLLAALTAVATAALSASAVAQGDVPAAPEIHFSVAQLLEDGGSIGYLIVVLSIVALGVAIDFGINLRHVKLCPPKLVEEVEALVAAGEYKEALELCEAEPTMFTNVAAAGLSKVTHDFAVVEQSLEQAIEDESMKLHTKVGWLSFICSVATLLGLLGTIQGMIVAFKTIAATRGQADPSQLSAGISAALITTLFGLCVAIPFSFAFVIFRNRVIYTTLELSTIVEELFERFRVGRAAR